MSFKLAFRWLALLAAVVVISASCGVQLGNLPNRVVGFMHSYDPENIQAFKEYFTPKIQEAFSSYDPGVTGHFAMPGMSSGLQGASKESLSKVTTGDLSFQLRRSKGHQWAQVSVTYDSATGVATEKLTWIKINGQWYLYSNTAGEQNEYGQPPYFVS
jgi:hypothetical protein